MMSIDTWSQMYLNQERESVPCSNRLWRVRN